MSEQQKPDWAKGLAAAGIALLIIGALLGFLLVPMILGGLILLCVGVATGRVRRDSERQEDRPWRNRTKD
ncbi:hypothetical protein ABZY44_23835 [Streptomyces sp. NPDC006544]|uniref:hypothetical protein n=1 Tax=Streptomyces sp. NPDC006544 TaxID=3154583 RepID=UPI0033BE5288